MKVVRAANELAPGGRQVCLAIGVFDGVHLGHQQIIRQTIADARKQGGIGLVVTFDRHPNAIVAPDKTPPAIYPLPQKLRAIASIGADATLLIEFNRAFSEQTGETFIRGLARDLGSAGARVCDPQQREKTETAADHRPALQSICVGADFVFGHKRSGNVPLLRQLGAELGFIVHGMAAVALDGEVVSSTRIRAALQSGDFDAASQMLGRPYSISGTVVHGDQLGNKLGFPTANVDVKGLVLPPDGVYAAWTTLKGVKHPAVLNLGTRPTVQNSQHERRLEVHLLNFTGNLYDHEIEVEFVAKLRDEMKFASLEALKAQIAADVAAATKCF